MTKVPRAGTVKTRLALEFGEIKAAELYKCFLLDIIEKLSKVSADVIIYYTPQEALNDLKNLIGESYYYLPQKGNNLGDRLYNGLEIAKKLGYRYAIALASDIPDIPDEYLITSVNSLVESTAVIGPSIDGGYNLIGFDLDYNDIRFFSEIEWGTNHVFMNTMERICNLDISVLETWHDVDKASDLKRLKLGGSSYTKKYLDKNVNF
jgi:uncharacterized protein